MCLQKTGIVVRWESERARDTHKPTSSQRSENEQAKESVRDICEKLFSQIKLDLVGKNRFYYCSFYFLFHSLVRADLFPSQRLY